MEFRISEATRETLKKSAQNQKAFQTKIDINSQKFYKEHSDLAPRNVYLRTGRIVKLKDVKKYFFRFDEPWYKQLLYPIIDFVDKIKSR